MALSLTDFHAAKRPLDSNNDVAGTGLARGEAAPYSQNPHETTFTVYGNYGITAEWWRIAG